MTDISQPKYTYDDSVTYEVGDRIVWEGDEEGDLIVGFERYEKDDPESIMLIIAGQNSGRRRRWTAGSITASIEHGNAELK